MGEKETAAEEAERLKTKTKSNQSNDRMDLDAGESESDSSDAEGAGAARRTDFSERATWTTSNPGLAGRSYSGPRQETQASRGGLVDADGPNPIGDVDGDGPPESAVNTSHSQLKNLRQSGSDDASGSGIAIGDPGGNGNLTGAQEIAVGDEGVPADKPRPKSSTR